MAYLNNFNARNIDPMVDFEPLPADKYLAIITDSEMKPTKSGNGEYLELTFQVIEDEYKGRKLWVRLNLDNPSLKAVEIARAELSSICRAVGVMSPKDSAELHDLPLYIKVICRKRVDTGDIINEIRNYAKIDGAAGSPSQKANESLSKERK